MPKISELPSGTVADADEVPVNQAGTTRKVTAIGVANRKTWANLAGIPATFPPEAHGHAQADVTDLVADLARLPLIVRKTANESNTSNTVSVDVADLGFTLEANTTYLIRWLLNTQVAINTTGQVIGIAGPASPTSMRLSFTGQLVQDSTNLFMRSATAYSDTIFSGTGGSFPPFVGSVYIDAMIVNGANAGVIIPRFRSEVNGSAVTVFANSFGMRWQLP